MFSSFFSYCISSDDLDELRCMYVHMYIYFHFSMLFFIQLLFFPSVYPSVFTFRLTPFSTPPTSFLTGTIPRSSPPLPLPLPLPLPTPPAPFPIPS